MDISPFIAALRRNRSPQRNAQSAMDAARQGWRAETGASELMEQLGRFGAGAPLEACPMLEESFTRKGEAERLMQLLSKHYCAVLRANPIGHPPFRHGYNGAASSILLARSGRAQLTLQSREPGVGKAASYLLSDAVRYDAVLAGKAEGRIVRVCGDAVEHRRTFEEQRLCLSGGERFAQDLTSEALVIDRIERRIVMLRLLRTAAEPEPTREYCAETGRLLQQSAGAIATSRTEAIVALLGRMGREDAAPEMARIALAESDLSLRWQALRECLSIDSERGFVTLCQIARKGDDPLAGQAGALRGHLLEAYPELAGLENQQCPA